MLKLVDIKVIFICKIVGSLRILQNLVITQLEIVVGSAGNDWLIIIRESKEHISIIKEE